jgi:hypothetical protein
MALPLPVLQSVGASGQSTSGAVVSRQEKEVSNPVLCETRVRILFERRVKDRLSGQ